MPKKHHRAADNLLGDKAVFLEVARQASFGRAAAELRLPQSSVSRKMLSIEHRLGTRLFVRSPRGVALTEAGALWAEHSRRILADVADAQDAMRGLSARPSGHLRVAVPVSFGVRHLSSAMSDFLGQHPEVTGELVFDDHQSDLFRDSIDAAVRIGTLADSRLFARRIGVNRRRLVGAPAISSGSARRRSPPISRGIPAWSTRRSPPATCGSSRTGTASVLRFG